MEDLSTIQCYQCREMGHYSRKCPNLLALPTKENVGFPIQRFSAKDKGNIHLIELMNEGQKNVLMGLERSLKIIEDVINVMA